MAISQDTLIAAAARAKKRPEIPKLAASPISPLNVKPPKNELLQTKVTWPQDVMWLSDTYKEIYNQWESLPFDTLEQQRALYEQTKPKLEELVLGLTDVSRSRTNRADLYKATERAGHDAQVAELYAKGGDFSTASLYQSYALIKLCNMLQALILEGSNYGDKRKASFLVKKGYGYDVSGEVQEGVGSNGDQKNLWDTAQSQDGHKTPKPKGNISVDTDAEQDFPELIQKKHHRVTWPART